MRLQLWEADKREENSSKMGLEASMLDLYLSPPTLFLVVVVGDAQAVGLKMKMKWICVKNEMGEGVGG